MSLVGSTKGHKTDKQTVAMGLHISSKCSNIIVGNLFINGQPGDCRLYVVYIVGLRNSLTGLITIDQYCVIEYIELP